MRDASRLKPFYEELARLHESLPDWRFSQLICNFADWYGGDIFFMEEKRFLELLKEYLKNLGVNTEG